MITSADVWDRYDSVNGSRFTFDGRIIVALIIILVLAILIRICFSKRRRNKKTPEDRLLTADFIDEMSVDSFIDITDEQYSQANDLGCYVLYNVDAGKYYIGKSPLCADAVNRHIIGKGNPDIFYEHRAGNDFTVKFYFVCEGSAYEDAENLCRDIVAVYSENAEVVEL